MEGRPVERERAVIDGAPGPVSDEARFAEIYPGLRRFAAVTASADVDPDDLVQEALASTLRTCGSLDTIDDLAAYLRRCIVNLESNHRRSRGREHARLRLTAPMDAEAAAYPSDLSDLDGLEPQQRAILYLFEVEGWPFGHIAELLDENESTIRRRATTARKLLRRQIQGDEQP